MKKQHNPNFILYWAIAIALAFTFGSCHSEQKALRKTQQYLFSHPDFSAGYCAEQFPVKDSIVTRDSIRYDTLYVADGSGIEPGIPNPGEPPQHEVDPLSPAGGGGSSSSNDPSSGGGKVIRYIIKTITKDTTIYKRDMAEEHRLNLSLQACQGNNNNLVNKNEELQQQVNEWKGKSKKWFWLFIALIAAGVTYTAIKFKKNILSLKNKLS